MTSQKLLTPREHEIVNFLRSGVPQRVIGQILGISFRTVRSHLNAIRDKLPPEYDLIRAPGTAVLIWAFRCSDSEWHEPDRVGYLLHYYAVQAVSAAIRRGVRTRPTMCSRCGSESLKIEAHHHRGYEPQNWLDVVWLCQPCHYEAGRRDRLTKKHYTANR